MIASNAEGKADIGKPKVVTDETVELYKVLPLSSLT